MFLIGLGFLALAGLSLIPALPLTSLQHGLGWLAAAIILGAIGALAIFQWIIEHVLPTESTSLLQNREPTDSTNRMRTLEGPGSAPRPTNSSRPTSSRRRAA